MVEALATQPGIKVAAYTRSELEDNCTLNLMIHSSNQSGTHRRAHLSPDEEL